MDRMARGVRPVYQPLKPNSGNLPLVVRHGPHGLSRLPGVACCLHLPILLLRRCLASRKGVLCFRTLLVLSLANVLALTFLAVLMPPGTNLAGHVRGGRYCARNMTTSRVLENSGVVMEPCFDVDFRIPDLVLTNYPWVSTQPPVQPRYLDDQHPGVVPIHMGRQLFVDSFLIDEERSSGYRRTMHRPEFRATMTPYRAVGEVRLNAFPGGVMWDAQLQVLRLYHKCMDKCICLLESHDGVAWFPYVNPDDRGTQHIMCFDLAVDAFSVFLDPMSEPDAVDRYKMSTFRIEITRIKGFTQSRPLELWTSADGLAWTLVGESSVVEDRSTISVDPFRRRYVLAAKENLFFQRHSMFWDAGEWTGPAMQWSSKRCAGSHVRALAAWTEVPERAAGATQQILACLDVQPDAPVYWVLADSQDSALGRPSDAVRWRLPALLPNDWKITSEFHIDKVWKHVLPQIKLRSSDIYGTDLLAYESIMLGFQSLWVDSFGPPKDIRIMMSYSRDGVHYQREPTRAPAFIDKSLIPDAKYTEFFMIGSGMVISPDDSEIYIFVRAFRQGSVDPSTGLPYRHSRRYTRQSGLQFSLRRDGFVSLSPSTVSQPAVIVTRPMRTQDTTDLWANVACAGGIVAVDVLDAHDASVVLATLPPLTHVDATAVRVGVLPAVVGRGRVAFRLRFQLVDSTTCRLYSFWTSNDPAGHSGGYLGGGRIGSAPTPHVMRDEIPISSSP